MPCKREGTEFLATNLGFAEETLQLKQSSLTGNPIEQAKPDHQFFYKILLGKQKTIRNLRNPRKSWKTKTPFGGFSSATSRLCICGKLFGKGIAESSRCEGRLSLQQKLLEGFGFIEALQKGLNRVLNCF